MQIYVQEVLLILYNEYTMTIGQDFSVCFLQQKHLLLKYYYMSKKSCPFLYNEYAKTIGQDFLDMWYNDRCPQHTHHLFKDNNIAT